MKRLLSISLVILIVLSNSFCRKKDNGPNTGWRELDQEECMPFVYDDPFAIVGISTSGIQYQFPCFNPDNSNELVYLRSNGSEHFLVKYNILSQEEIILVEGYPIQGQPSWTRSGWIFFTIIPNAVYKVNENGGLVTQITDSQLEAYNLGVDKTTDLVLIHANGQDLTNEDYFGIYNSDGNILDSLRWRFGNIFAGGICEPLDNHKNGYKIFGDATNTDLRGICKIVNGEVVVVKLLEPEQEGNITVAQNDKYFFYAIYKDGLYKLNKQTLETRKLEDLCGRRNIESMSISDDGNFLLLHRLKGTLEGGQGLYNIDKQSDIYMYHIGLGMQKKILAEE